MQKVGPRKVKVVPQAPQQGSDGPDLSPGRLAGNWEQRGLKQGTTFSGSSLALGQGRLIYFCWASLCKCSHIPIHFVLSKKGPASFSRSWFLRIQSPRGGSPTQPGVGMHPWPSGHLAMQSENSQFPPLRWGMGWGGGWAGPGAIPQLLRD